MVLKRFKKSFSVIHGVFEFFDISRFFSQNDVFRLFAHDYPFLIFLKSTKMAYFVPIFFTEFFPEVDMGPSGTTYEQMNQNCLKNSTRVLSRERS